jgi:hypothetical protein
MSAGRRKDLSCPDSAQQPKSIGSGAADIITEHPVALELRTLQTMAETIGRGLHKIACSGGLIDTLRGK